jgi:perosamine synthetase
VNVPYHRYWFGGAEEQAVLQVLRSGWLTSGQRVAAFEAAFAHWKRTDHAIAVNSCTAALLLALQAAGIGPGDEVLVPAITFAATANVVELVGARPVLLDVDLRTGLIPLETLVFNTSYKTRAILLVHLAGLMYDMPRVMALAEARGWVVIEDCAHALEAECEGRPSGTWGHYGAFSFYPNKNITTGEGGMLLTRQPQHLERLRAARNHGLNFSTYDRERYNQQRTYDILLPGYKFNMNEIQAALGLAQLEKVEAFHTRRQEIADRYRAGLADCPAFSLPPEAPTHHRHGLHLFPVQLQLERLTVDKDTFVAALRDSGVQVSALFRPINQFSYYLNKYNYRLDEFPQAHRLFLTTFALPFYPLLSNVEVDYVLETLLRLARRFER